MNKNTGHRPNINNTNKYTPQQNSDALSIVGLVKSSGKVAGYQLSDGSKVTKTQGVDLAKQNKIKGVAVAVNQGTEYLRALPDGGQNNNLGNLPSISEKI